MRILAILLLLASSGVWAFESGRASFAIRIADDVIPYEVFAIYVLPGERLDLEAIGEQETLYTIATDGGELEQSAQSWSWAAPAAPGLRYIEVSSSTDAIRLNVFVLHPAASVDGDRLNGFRIGAYPTTPLRNEPAYLPPDGFVELNENTASIQLSPHFRLSQFPSKQAGGYPKYLVLRERLLIKLELLLERLNEVGVAAEGLTIMSGFRTPFYNEAIGNVPNSRHVFGGAADLFVDRQPADNIMDDLNGDGVIDYRDAQFLYRIAHRLFAEPANRWLVGGLGVYRRTAAHGPFLHLDARGVRARWGLIP